MPEYTIGRQRLSDQVARLQPDPKSGIKEQYFHIVVDKRIVPDDKQIGKNRFWLPPHLEDLVDKMRAQIIKQPPPRPRRLLMNLGTQCRSKTIIVDLSFDNFPQ